MATQKAPQNVIGRDKQIKTMWSLLATDSIVFTAERRIGKTTVLNKMAAEPKADHVVIFSDLEKVNSAKAFVESIINDLKHFLPKTKKAGKLFDDFLSKLGGTEIGGMITLPEIKAQDWQPLLEDTITTVCSNQSEVQWVFLWDELPYMLQNIHVSEQKQSTENLSALRILDTLRSLRQQHQNLRMIFTGSVGLHHVLSQLRNNQLASQPTNDMETVEIGPLTQKHAQTLVKQLLESQEVEYSDDLVVDEIITLTDAVPFYIEKVIKRLGFEEELIDSTAVVKLVNKLLVDPKDPWEMEHFRERLDIYYDHTFSDSNNQRLKAADIARLLLDHMALSQQPQSINQCVNFIRSQLQLEQKHPIIDILKSLARDHYIEPNVQGHYQFRFGLLKRWWLIAQGLNDE